MGKLRSTQQQIYDASILVSLKSKKWGFVFLLLKLPDLWWKLMIGVLLTHLVKWVIYWSKVVSTHLWNTPLNLSQQAVSQESFHSWRTGDCLGCAISGCVVTVLELKKGQFFMTTRGDESHNFRLCRVSGIQFSRKPWGKSKTSLFAFWRCWSHLQLTLNLIIKTNFFLVLKDCGTFYGFFSWSLPGLAPHPEMRS